jgi:hypothetical protein
MKSKKDLSQSVDLYISEQAQEQQELLQALRELILKTVPGVAEGLKWGMPWYWRNDKICYLAAYKKHVNLGFAQGAYLDDPDKLFEGTGKGMRHIKIKSAADIRKREFTRLLKSAARYDSNNN